MFIDKAQRAQLTARLADVRQEIDELHTERLALNKDAAGAEGDRHAFIGARLWMLRATEQELSAPLLDAAADDNRNAPP